MEHETNWGEHLPGEIVETYRQAERREVVETYVRPLPGTSAAPEKAPKAAPEPDAPSPKRKWRGFWTFLGLLVLAAGFTTGAWFWNQAFGEEPEELPSPHFEFELNEDEIEEITIPTYPINQGAVLQVDRDHGPVLTAQEVYRKVNPSVVTVIAQLEEGMSVGAGVIFTEDGYVLTNFHVLEGGTDCTVTLSSDRTYAAKYVAGDAVNDLAVLKMDVTGLPAARFGESEALTVGDAVYAIGNPLGIDLRGTLTDGIVSAINRDVWVDGRGMNLIQTNAALNSGNSGGPLINAYGQVVGINTIKMSSAYDSVEGLGFAIPSASLRVMVNDLLTLGEVQPEPALGVTVPWDGTQLDGTLWGLEVIEVAEDSAADLAGVEAGDYIIAAGGRTVEGRKELLQARRQARIGDELPMTLWRDGRIMEVVLLLKDPI